MNGEFLSKVMSMNDANALEQLRDQLIMEAAAGDLRWDSRMTLYKRVQTIIERLIQLELE